MNMRPKHLQNSKHGSIKFDQISMIKVNFMKFDCIMFDITQIRRK